MSKIKSRINFNTQIVEGDGTPAEWQVVVKGVQQKNEDGSIKVEPAMLRKAIYNALNATFKTDNDLPQADLVKKLSFRGKLARKVINSSSADYTQEELDDILTAVAQAYGAMILSQINELIEGKETEGTNEAA